MHNLPDPSGIESEATVKESSHPVRPHKQSDPGHGARGLEIKGDLRQLLDQDPVRHCGRHLGKVDHQ